MASLGPTEEPNDETEAIADSYWEDTWRYHGREYHTPAIRQNVYFEPVDEYEFERTQQMDQVLSVLFDQRLVFRDIGSAPERILDCGYGNASWITRVAEMYPSCSAIGLDMSPQLCSWTDAGESFDEESNVHLQIDNLNERLNFRSNYFDLVNSSMVSGGINRERWPSYVQDIFRTLKPGGWCQMVEIEFEALSFNHSLGNESALRYWSQEYYQSMRQAKDIRAGRKLEGWMRRAGFISRDARELRLPMCAWSADPREYQLGELNQSNVSALLSSVALYPITTFREMPANEFEILVAQARQEAANPEYQPYFKVYVVVGRKPLPPRRR